MKEGSSSRVIVKFHDSLSVPYEDGAEAHLAKRGLPWDELAREAPGLSLRRMFTSIPPDRIQALVKRAAALDPTYHPPNPLTYFVVDVPPGVEPEAVVTALRRWPSVYGAYVESFAEGATVDPTDDPYWKDQGYLKAATAGIDAEYAWTVPGGDGTGQRIVAVEQGVDVHHEDLSASVVYGNNLDTQMFHGTATVGIYSMLDNNKGGIGIAPGIDRPVNVLCHDEYDGNLSPQFRISDLIYYAIYHLSPDVIEIAQAWTVDPTESLHLDPLGQPWMRLPIEAHDPIFDAINLATSLGIVVVEAAGTRHTGAPPGYDLDTYQDSHGNYILKRGNPTLNISEGPGFRDSGAIIVSGATYDTHARGSVTNFGSRIDCYAWGNNITTSWYPDSKAYTNEGGVPAFGGPSGASAIIAGAALSLQGMVEAQLGWPGGWPPWEVRKTLSDPALGTPSANPPTDKIGVMPDLKSIAEYVPNQMTFGQFVQVMWKWIKVFGPGFPFP